MGIEGVAIVSVISALEAMVIVRAFGKSKLRTVLGYKVWIDIVYGFGFTAWSIMQGSVSAFIMASLSGFAMTLILSFFAGVYGYRRYEKQKDGTKAWVEYESTITVKSLKTKFNSLMTKLNGGMLHA